MTQDTQAVVFPWPVLCLDRDGVTAVAARATVAVAVAFFCGQFGYFRPEKIVTLLLPDLV